jgi:hypothetical protein
MDHRANKPIRWDDLNNYRRPGPITLAWRWRAEIALMSAILGLLFVLAHLIGLFTGVLVMVAIAEVLYAVPLTRHWIFRRCRCVFTRHRLYSVFRETRTTTLTGRLPLIIRVSPTAQGERVVVWCRAGISVERLQRIRREIRDGCMASGLNFQPGNASLARMEIIRVAPNSPGKPWISSSRRTTNGDHPEP